MSNGHDIPDLQRVTFFAGQQLTATDLAELEKAQRMRAWLHNRSLHSWGIGIGLAVTGEAGASMVEVAEGYAIDCLGREIILTESKTLPVPAVAGTPSGGEAVYYLVAGYQEDDDQAVAERRRGVCVPEGTVRLTEEPRLEWLEAVDVDEGIDVILAKAWVKNCQLSQPLSLLERRSARPSQYPYINANQTQAQAGGTVWERWYDDNGLLVGVTTFVDTSVARFQATPWYMAHVVGERYFNSRFIVSQDAVTEATPTGFTFRAHLRASFTGDILDDFVASISSSDSDDSSNLAWHVVWMGIEV